VSELRRFQNARRNDANQFLIISKIITILDLSTVRIINCKFRRQNIIIDVNNESSL